MRTATLPTTTSNEHRFPSVSALRIAHRDLLKRYRQHENKVELTAAITDFILKGKATGVLLDNDADRWSCQSLLDYWTSILYRADYEPPDATLEEFDPILAPELKEEDCPYLGLEAFRQNHADLLFGREHLLAQLIKKLKTNRLLAVVGASGSGKSSVVLGGLIPSLKSGTLPNSECWHYLPPMVPGSKPLETLAQLLDSDEHQSVDWITQQAHQFKKTPNHLAKLVNQLVPDTPTVLVIDQFEEIFTLCPSGDVRQAFINNIVNLIQVTAPKHIVVLTMRSDFESQVARVANFKVMFDWAQVRVTAMDASELRQAIEKPAELVGLKFEEGIVDALLNDVLGEPAALPLLQFTLLKLWDHRERNRVTWDAYQRLGGGRLALARSADSFYKQLIPEDQLTVKRILMRMIRPGEGLEYTSNRICRQDIYQAGEARDRIDRVLAKLVQANLVRLRQGETPEDDQIEVAHEALVRNWPLLVEWLEQERRTHRHRLRLTASAEDWCARGRDRSLLLRGSLLEEALSYSDLNSLETEFVKRSKTAKYAKLRLLIGSMSATIIALLGLSFYAFDRATVAWEEAKITKRQNQELITKNQAIITKNQAIISKNDAIERLQQALILFAQNQQLDALIETLKAGRQLAESNQYQEPPITAALQQAVYGIREFNRLEAHAAKVSDLAFSPDGTLIASAGNDKKVIIWQADGRLHQELTDHLGTVTSVAFNHSGQILASADANGTVKLWQLKQGTFTILKKYNTGGKVRDLAFSHNGSWLAIAYDDPNSSVGNIGLWSVESQTVKRLDTRSAAHGFHISQLKFSPDDRFLASVGEDRLIKLWKLDNNKLEPHQVFKQQSSGVRSIAFAPDSLTLATTSNSQITLWTLTGTPVKTLIGHSKPIRDIKFSPDGQKIVSVADDSTLKLWTRQGTLIETFYGHQGPVLSVDFNLQGNVIASSGDDGTVRLWQANGSLISSAEAHTDTILGLSFSSSGRQLASAAADRRIKLWQINDQGNFANQLPTIFPEQKGLIWQIEFYPRSNNSLASVGREYLRIGNVTTPVAAVKLWDFQGNVKYEKRFPRAEIQNLAFINQGQTLVTPINWHDQTRQNEAKIWNVSGQSLQPQVSFQTELDAIYAVAVNPEREIVAFAGEDGIVKLLHDEQHWSQLPFQDASLRSLAFSPDGKLLASGRSDGHIVLSTMDDTANSLSFEAHATEVLSLAFKPGDSSLLVSGGAEGRLQFWQIDPTLKQPTLLRTIQTQTAINTISFSPNGKVIAVSALETQAYSEAAAAPQAKRQNHIIQIWNADIFPTEEALLDQACDLVDDYLTHNRQAQNDQEIRDVKTFCQG